MSSISIPCIVKLLNREPVSGFIVGDKPDGMASLRGAEFDVRINGKITAVPKLYVYPDLSVERIADAGKSPSTDKLHNDKNLSPSKSARRRKKGTGSGSIYYRAVNRKGTAYQQAYYHYRLDGKKRTKYIPQKLLGLIKAAEAEKRPINEILFLLGEKSINPSKSSDTFNTEGDRSAEQEAANADISPGKSLSPSKNVRSRGDGSGSIHCKPIKRGRKEYKQYWYHYEFWQSGERLVKRSRYIPKKLLARVQRMDADKIPVKNILTVLGVGL